MLSGLRLLKAVQQVKEVIFHLLWGESTKQISLLHLSGRQKIALATHKLLSEFFYRAKNVETEGGEHNI